jgi:hypothetical protein
VDGEGTETGGFAAGDGARGGRLGRWRSCLERMLEKMLEVVLQWSTQTLRQGTVIRIFFLKKKKKSFETNNWKECKVESPVLKNMHWVTM